MSDAEAAAAARTLRGAAFASAAVATLRFGLLTAGGGLPGAVSRRLDTVIAIAGLVVLVFFVETIVRLRKRTQGPLERRMLAAAAALIGSACAIECALWAFDFFGTSGWSLAEPALVAVLLAGTGRAALWFALVAWLVRARSSVAAPLAAAVPLAVGLRVCLFGASLLAPYLESGGEARRIFLATSTLRSWLALSLGILCDGLIAWLAGRAARAV